MRRNPAHNHLFFAFLWLISFLLAPPRADALDPTKAITQYVHDSWQIQDGLPQNSVQVITQTRDGFLWLGTQEGLVRFDGARFTVFNRQNTSAMRSHDIFTMLEDRDGALWIGTLGGGLLRYLDGYFTGFGVSQGLNSEFIRSLYQDHTGKLWIGTEKGVTCYSDGKFRSFTLEDGLGGNFVRSVGEDSDGNMWFGTDGGGVSRYDGTHFRTFTTADGLAHNFVSVIYRDRRGTLYLGTFGGGISRFRNDAFETLDYGGGPTYASVRSIREDRNGALWIGTEGGLARGYEGRWDHFGSEQGLTNDVIWSLLEDQEGSLWIGTYNGGLNRLRDGNLTPYTRQEGMSHDAVWSVMEDRQGRIWAGTVGGGVSILDHGVIQILNTRNGLPNDFVRALYEDPGGTVWIGTNGGGLCRWENNRCQTLTTKDGLSSNFIRSVYMDSHGDLWVGTNGQGLNRIRNGLVTQYTSANGFASDYIRSILEDRRHRLWIATDGGGLVQFENEKFTTYDVRRGLSQNVLSLYLDADDTLWIGTIGSGLFWLRDDRIYHAGLVDGLFDDVVFQVLEDLSGNLWMGCNKGIFRVSKENLLEFAEGKVQRINSVSYGITDGMKSPEVNGGSSPPGWRAHDGRLWFPTIRGLVLVDPARFRWNPTPPPVLIQSVEINGMRYDLHHEIVVPPGAGRLRFEYTALSLLAPERVQFKIQLEGFDQGWQDSGTTRSTLYTNIPPGKYRFRVKACNNDGIWNEEGAAVAFRLKPHFYQTYWFYALCLIALIYTVSGVQRFRLNQLRAREEELSRVVQERTRDLLKTQEELELSNRKLADANENLEQRVEEGIGKLREAERMAAYGSMVAGVAHEVRQPLFALQAAAYVLTEKLAKVETVQKQLKTLDRESHRMAVLMDDLLEFARPSSPQIVEGDVSYVLREAVESFNSSYPEHGLQIELEIAQDVPKMMMDQGRVQQVFANLMGNARKHATGATRIVLTADPVPLLPGEDRVRWVRFRVSDNGAGIPAEHMQQIFEPFYTTGKGTGLGLAIVHRIVTDHKGTIKAESTPGEGATFTIFLPVEGPHEAGEPRAY